MSKLLSLFQQSKGLDIFVVACAVLSGAALIRRKRYESSLDEIQKSVDRVGEKLKLLKAQLEHVDRVEEQMKLHKAQLEHVREMVEKE